ncbi:hypothetical protein [Burkholderia sp. 572]|uniref:hypothetical protein n=1 Tax=Burkholderia sp. 572 TaxID=3156414 RepID=UPI003393B64F
MIVSDLRTPSLCGIDLLQRVKRLYPDFVRILLSGYAEAQSITDTVDDGSIQKLLTKPSNVAPLRKRITEAFQ